MANSKGQSGSGAVFSVSATSTGTYSPVGDITDAPFALGENGSMAATQLASTSEEIIPTLKKITTIDLKLNRNSSDAGQVLLHTNYISQAPIYWKLQFPVNTLGGQTTTGDLVSGSAFVLSSPFAADKVQPTEIITTTCKLSVIGLPTIVEGS